MPMKLAHNLERNMEMTLEVVLVKAVLVNNVAIRVVL